MPKEKNLKELQEEFQRDILLQLIHYMNKAFPLMIKQVLEKDEARQLAERSS